MNNKRVFQNAIWIIGCKIVQAVLALVVTMLSARYLGPSGYGLINYAASVVAFATPIMQLGLNSTLVQELVENPECEGEIVGTSLVMSTISALACIVGVVSFSAIMNPNEPTTTVVCGLYSICLIFQGLELIQYWFQAKLLSKYTSLTMLAAYVVMSAYKIVLLVSGRGIYWFALSQALDFAVISVVLLIVYCKVGQNRLSFSWRRIGKLFFRSRYYIVSSLMVTFFAQTDRIMLKMMRDEAAVGYYSAAVSCAGMTGFVFTAIIDSMRPTILENKLKDLPAYEHGMQSLYGVVIYLALAQSAVISLTAGAVVRFLYGEAYAQAVPMLRIVVWYTTFSYLGSVRNIWILAEGKQKYLWIINLSGAVANILLNAAMIPLWGGSGAAAASLITQAFTNVLLGFILKPIRPNNRIMLKGLDVRSIFRLLRRHCKNS